jgi:parallel beta-helix repeat protein
VFGQGADVPTAGNSPRSADDFVVNVRSFGARGDGNTDDTAAIALAMKQGAGKNVYFPSGTYLISEPIHVPSDTTVLGNGGSSILKTDTTGVHLFVCKRSVGVTIRSLKFVGVFGKSTTANSAVIITESSNCRVLDCEATGMSGMVFLITGSDRISIERNYIHGLTAQAESQNSADIALYYNCRNCVIRDNRCMGGGQTWIGISVLGRGSFNNLIDNNDVGPHYAYGILDYSVQEIASNTIITNNRITTIDGAALKGNAGAGIYTAGTGGQTIANNHIDNTNVGTSSRSLAPAAIGINQATAAITIHGNTIRNAQWYGIYVVGTSQPVTIHGNVVEGSVKEGIYLNAVSNGKVIGNRIIQSQAKLAAAPCIAVNSTPAIGPFFNCQIQDNTTVGGAEGIAVGNTEGLIINGNDVKEAISTRGAINVFDARRAVIANNNVDARKDGSTPAIVVSSVKDSTISANVFSSAAYANVLLAGDCTNSRYDEANVIVEMTEHSIDNRSVGCIVSTSFHSPFGANNNCAVGDRIRNSHPTSGSPKGWICTSPGTGHWTPEADL